MSKKTAFLCHFSLSLLVVGTVLAVVFLLWYPGLYFQVVGAMDVLKVLICVDLILGPLLTLILYKPGKPGLVVDICLIAAIQLAALVYGVQVIHKERPYYTVFSVDRFEVLARRDVDFSKVDNPALFEKPWGEPLVVFAEMPADPKELSKIVEETLFEGKPDIHKRPELWHPYQEMADEVIARAKSLSELRELRPDVAVEIDALIERQGTDALVYVPIMGKKQVFSLVIDEASKTPVEIINADPWEKAPSVAQSKT